MLSDSGLVQQYCDMVCSLQQWIAVKTVLHWCAVASAKDMIAFTLRGMAVGQCRHQLPWLVLV